MKTGKKLILTLFAMVVISAIFCFGASALETTGQCGDNVYWKYNESTRELVISGSGATYDYNYTKSPFFNSEIVNVSISKEVTTVGRNLFRECMNLCNVSFSNSVTSIGESAFGDCASLTNVTIPDSVTTIGYAAFSGCEKLLNITINKNVKTIERFAFEGCKVFVDNNNKYFSSDDNGVLFNKLKTTLIQYPTRSTQTEYSVPNSVKTIEYQAFYGAQSLKKIVIPNSVVTIGDRAFQGCTNLISVTIPESVVSIGERAFHSCSSLAKITIPESVIYIGAYAFDYTMWYDNQSDGLIYLGKFVYRYKGEASYNSTVVIESGTKKIVASAFSGVENMVSIIIPDSVTTIGEFAFAGCSDLEKLTIGSGVKEIGCEAFRGCYKFKTVCYTGTENQWKELPLGENEQDPEQLDESNWQYLTSAKVQFVSVKDELLEEATCQSTGTKRCICSCGESYIQIIQKTDHSYSSYIVDKKATCTAEGSKSKHCTRSGCTAKTSVTAIPKIGSVTLSKENYIYDGKNKTPKVTVKDADGNTLVKNVDYKLSVASKRSGIGRYTVKVTFIGNYSGTKSVYFYIKTAKPATVKSASQTTSSVKLSWSAVPGAAGYTVYRYSPSKKAYVKAGTTEGTSYTVKSLYAGTKYTFRVVSYGKTTAGKVYDSDSYALLKTATKTKTPTLSKVTTTKGKATLTHTNVSGETGYTVYYSTKKDSGFKKYANFKADTTTCNITGLTSGKTYYFKVRTYITTDSGYVYSAWSAVKSVKTK